MIADLELKNVVKKKIVISTEPERATRNLLNCLGFEISRRSFGRSVEMTLPLNLQ